MAPVTGLLWFERMGVSPLKLSTALGWLQLALGRWRKTSAFARLLTRVGVGREAERAIF
jgi:hypothetical protein